MKIFQLAFVLIPYLIFNFFSGILNELGLKKTPFYDRHQENYAQCINNNYNRQQLQTLQILAENETQLLASTEEDKSLPRNNSGKFTENMLP